MKTIILTIAIILAVLVMISNYAIAQAVVAVIIVSMGFKLLWNFANEDFSRKSK